MLVMYPADAAAARALLSQNRQELNSLAKKRFSVCSGVCKPILVVLQRLTSA
jgi:hypothetical protein